MNRALSAALLLAVAAAGCKRDSDERLGLDDKKLHEFDPESLASGAELEKAVSISTEDAAKKLGAYKLVQSAKLQLASGEAKDALDETWVMSIDGKGGTALLHENSHDYGFETVILGGQIYVKPRYGRFVRRPIEGDEVERARDEHEGALASWLAVLGRFADRKDGGATSHLGRPAHKVILSLASSPSRLRDKEPAHQWRRSVRVSALSGEVIVDDASGAPLKAQLDAAYTTPRAVATEGETPKGPAEVSVTLAFHSVVEDLGAVPAVEAPADATSALRPRPLLDKQVLLDGLVTPPSGPSTGR